MKLLIELDEGDEAALVALAESEMRSKTAQAKKLLVDAIRLEIPLPDSEPAIQKEGAQ